MKQNQKTQSKSTFAIVGKWFHSFVNQKVQYQGQVLDYDPHSQLCLVQLYNWLDGAPHEQKLFHITEMKEWMFYNTNEEMNEFYELYHRHKIFKE